MSCKWDVDNNQITHGEDSVPLPVPAFQPVASVCPQGAAPLSAKACRRRTHLTVKTRALLKYVCVEGGGRGRGETKEGFASFCISGWLVLYKWPDPITIVN